MVTKELTKFHVGDWIVHYYHGVGKVIGVVEKGLADNRQKFYKVSTKEIDYWLPYDNVDVDHIEPLRTKQDFEEALKILTKPPRTIAEHHKSRKKRIHERWLQGDLVSRAKLMRDLNGRLKFEKLSYNEKEMLEKVRKYFINEWVIADRTLNRKKAKTKIKKALQLGIEKATTD